MRRSRKPFRGLSLRRGFESLPLRWSTQAYERFRAVAFPRTGGRRGPAPHDESRLSQGLPMRSCSAISSRRRWKIRVSTASRGTAGPSPSPIIPAEPRYRDIAALDCPRESCPRADDAPPPTRKGCWLSRLALTTVGQDPPGGGPGSTDPHSGCRQDDDRNATVWLLNSGPR